MRLDFRTLSAVLLTSVLAAGCDQGDSETAKQLQSVYDEKTGKLELLKYDSNGDGKVDTWSYMDGARIVRIEIDKDADGLVDRWEHYRSDQTLAKVGASRSNDGVEDSWFYPGSDGTLARIEVSTRRDGKVSRVEHFQQDQLIVAEEDVDANGAMDKWELYEGDRLAAVEFDTKHRGKPDRRLIYAADGSARLEIDPKGSGQFVPAKEARTSGRRNRK